MESVKVIPKVKFLARIHVGKYNYYFLHAKIASCNNMILYGEQ